MSEEIAKIGPYILVEEIGRGAMGVVHRAKHELTQREVALKVIFENVASSFAGAERFRREVSVSSLVDDDGIVEVYDAGEFEGMLFYAMELLKGRDLDSVMAELSLGERVDVVIDVMKTVAKCHDAGIVHRDLKPENIYIRETSEGRSVKVLDFGIASIQQSPTATQTGYALGTPSYMSPEQAMAPKTAGPASDIWSAGVLLYEAATGELPFDDETPAAVMIKVVNRPHPELPGHVPTALAQIIDVCLEKKPEKRFENAGQLVEALMAYRSGGATEPLMPKRSKKSGSEPTIAKPPHAVEDSEKTSIGAIPVAVGVLLISLLVGGALALNAKSDRANEIVAASSETEKASVTSPSPSPSLPVEPPVAEKPVTRAAVSGASRRVIESVDVAKNQNEGVERGGSAPTADRDPQPRKKAREKSRPKPDLEQSNPVATKDVARASKPAVDESDDPPTAAEIELPEVGLNEPDSNEKPSPKRFEPVAKPGTQTPEKKAEPAAKKPAPEPKKEAEPEFFSF